MRILVVRDERKAARALEESLSAEAYSVAVAHTGEDGFSLASGGGRITVRVANGGAEAHGGGPIPEFVESRSVPA